MSRVLLLLLLFVHSYGQNTKLIGKLNIDNRLASVFQDLVSQFLSDDTKSQKTEININRLVSNFKNADKTPGKQKSDIDESQQNKNVKMLNVNLNVGGDIQSDEIQRSDDKPKVVKNDKNRQSGINSQTAKQASSHKTKTKRHRHIQQSTQAIIDEHEHKRNKHRKRKNKGIRKEHRQSKIENKDVEKEQEEKKIISKHSETQPENIKTDTKISQRQQEGNQAVIVNVPRDRNEEKKSETYDAVKDNEEKKVENNKTNVNILREKTILEEIVGMDRNVHVYGNHKREKYDLPLNNIKV